MVVGLPQAKRLRVQAKRDFFLQISFSWVKMNFHVEFHPPGLIPSWRKFCVGGWVVGGGGGGVEGNFSVTLWSKPGV